MALIKCKACGQAISKKADKCPSCGEPVKRKTLGCMSALLIVGVALVAGVMITQQNAERSPTAATTPKPTADCTKQADRQAFIQKLINDGYWQKTDRPSTILRVYVMPQFLALTMDDKKAFLSTASAYDLCGGGDGMLSIIDAISGENIGRFDEYGLHMKD